MTLTLQQWHNRFKQQARWTYNLRKYIYDRVDIKHAQCILDVGCGTGVLMDELNRRFPAALHGLDINPYSIKMAHELVPKSIATIGDALRLPYRSGTFDITLCHFLLLWVSNPLMVIKEMVRVTSGNGYVLALAEPDYGGRIDYPDELSVIGKWQAVALKEQGANPSMGRELRSLFSCMGLANIEAGVLGGQWIETQPDSDFELEWDVIQSDLDHYDEFIIMADKLKALELTSRAANRRILYVPTFYAFGQVKV